MATLSEQVSMIARKKVIDRQTKIFEITFDIAHMIFDGTLPEDNIVEYIISTYDLTMLEVTWIATILDVSMRASLAFMEKFELQLIELDFPKP